VGRLKNVGRLNELGFVSLELVRIREYDDCVLPIQSVKQTSQLMIYETVSVKANNTQGCKSTDIWHTIIAEDLRPFHGLFKTRQMCQLYPFDLSGNPLLRACIFNVIGQWLGRDQAYDLGDAEASPGCIAGHGAAKVGHVAAGRSAADVGGMDVGLRDKDVSLRRARGEDILGGCDDLAAGLELFMVRGGRESMQAQCQLRGTRPRKDGTSGGRT